MARTTKIVDGVTWYRSVSGVWRDADGYDREGRDGWGRNRAGFARSGWNALGIHEETGSIYGPDGYTKSGRDSEGFNRRGFDSTGVHRNGTRYDDRGFDQRGYHRNRTRRDDEGLRRDETREQVTPVEEAVEEVAPASHEGDAKCPTAAPTEERTFISPSQARAYLLGRIARVSSLSTDDLFYMSTVVAPWHDSFRSAWRSDDDQDAFRLYCATRAAFDRLMEDGEIRKFGSLWTLTDAGIEACKALSMSVDMYRRGVQSAA